MVRAFASQSIDLGFNFLVESYQKTLKNAIHTFSVWRSAQKGIVGRTSQQARLMCPWARHLNGMLPSIYDKQVVGPSSLLVMVGRSNRKPAKRANEKLKIREAFPKKQESSPHEEKDNKITKAYMLMGYISNNAIESVLY